MLFKKYILAASLISLLFACSGPGMSSKAPAEKGNALLESLKQGNIEEAMEKYSEKFFEMKSRESWREQLENINKKVGQIQTYEIKQLSSDTRYSGKFFIFEYKVVHANGATWQTLTLVNPNNTQDAELIGHKIKILGK